VQEVRKCAETGKWLVSVLPGRPYEGSERCVEVTEDHTIAELEVHAFDAIAICTGTNNFSSLPHFPGQELFKGRIVHSESYKDAEGFKGKHVLVVGAGESGSDICNEISKVAATCGIAIRGKHGHIIPRIQSDGRVTDLNTNRCRYSNPYILGDLIGYTNQLTKRAFSLLQPKSDEGRVLAKIRELNLEQGTSAFSKFGCKNEGFVAAMVLRDAQLFRGSSFTLTADKAVFDDGRQFPCDAIVACTGFRNTFPFLDKHHPELNHAGMNPRLNFKQVISVDFPTEIGFFGFARPAFGSIPPTAEMQARLWTMAISGDISLPDKAHMMEVAKVDQLNWEKRFGHDAHRVKGLVDYQLYCDGIAEIIGAMPPLRQLLLNKPLLWFKIFFGPFTVHQYRLRGPGADPVRAEAVLLRQPVGDLLESCVTVFFLALAKLLSLLGFKQFQPNNF